MKKPKTASLPPVTLGGIYFEELPFPYVHYPSHYGAFIAFSREKEEIPYLCECSKSSVENFFELRKQIVDEAQDGLYDVGNHFDQLKLPEAIVQIIRDKNSPFSELKFRRALCHRCNLTPPTVRFCHEMYGVRFVQYFGWYVEQAYLRFGILPRGIKYLEGVTPQEYIANIEAIVETRDELADAWEWFHKRDELTRQRMNNHNLELPDDDFDEIAKRQSILRNAQKKNRRAERALSKKIENIIREEFGHKKVGERWTSETLLYQIVGRLYTSSQILRHHRPDWLDGLELDIFIPEINLGIEYQGQQHFHPIKAWGGEKALRDLQERDNRKAQLCQSLGVILVTIDYTEPLTMEHVRTVINSHFGDTHPPNPA